MITESEKRLHRVCFTGHRPEKLERSEAEIMKDLEKEIRRALSDGMNVFISGIARGTDIWASQIVLKLKKQEVQIKLICACPYPGFEKGWNYAWQKQYKDILAAADFVKYVCKSYGVGCFQKRNEWMVNHSARVIAVFNGKSGGTKNTIAFSKKAGVPVVLLGG